jgi:NAD+ diphosphatase
MIYKFCPDCGNNCEQIDEKTFKCKSCENNWFNQPVSASATIIFNSKGQILFVRRAKDPCKGMLGLPAGFSDLNETLEQTAIREIKEETGIHLNTVTYIKSYPFNYLYKSREVPVILSVYFAKYLENKSLINIDNEVTEFKWLSKENINFDEIGADVDKLVVKDYLESEKARHR